MKWIVFLIALLFLLPATAQEGRDGGPDDSARGDQGRSNSANGPDREAGPDARPARGPERAASMESGFVHVGNFVSISYENETLTYELAGLTWFTANITDPQIMSRERQVFIASAEGKFVISDNPTGHVSYRGQSIDIEFTGTPTVRGQGSSLEQEGKIGFFFMEEKRETFFSFHVKQPSNQPERDEHIQDAIASRKVAARVSGEDVESYDDVNVSVDRPAKATAETPYRVVIGAELPEGRTIVLDVDREMLTGPDLDLRYFDLNDDGTETEVVFRQAASLEDILEPTDDAGQPEYWIVEDENGIQVMVSIPHWSTHAVTLASMGTFVQPQVWIGIAVGAVVTVLAAGLIMRPRREE